MTAPQWEQFSREQVWAGSPVDLQDGFIHFSAWGQVAGTLEKHFEGQDDLQLIGVPVEHVREQLRWEVSRGGQMFPHVYRELRLADVGNRRKIQWVDDCHQVATDLMSGSNRLEMDYPLFVLHHGPGYVSLVDASAGGEPPPQALALFSSHGLAAEFVERMVGFAGIKTLRNGRELQWLLASLKYPVSDAVLDPAMDRPEIAGVWRRTIRELVEEHIEIDHSPWVYPIYLLRQTHGDVVSKEGGGRLGWSSISAGEASNRFVFVAMFTDELAACEYRERTESEDGWSQVVEVTGRVALREILVGLGAEIAGVAVNPSVEAGVRKCGNCLEIGRLLDHYLTADPPPGPKIQAP